MSDSEPTDFVKMGSPMPLVQVNRQTSGLAIASMVLGIVSFVFVGIILGPLAIIFGSIAIKKIDKHPHELSGRGMALAGIICGIVVTVLNVAFLVFVLTSGSFSGSWEYGSTGIDEYNEHY